MEQIQQIKMLTDVNSIQEESFQRAKELNEMTKESKKKLKGLQSEISIALRELEESYYSS